MSRSWAAPGKVLLLGEYAVLDGAPALVAAVDSGVRCDWEPGDVLRIEAPDHRFVLPALEAAGARPGRWRFTPWRPPPTQSKPGLGSSAAATVVAVRAGLESSGAAHGPDEVFRIARAVHARVQGSGSGVDVAASSWGGVLRFEGGVVRPALRVEPVVIWSGSSAATGPRVERYLAWPERRDFVQRSRELVEVFDADPIGALREGFHLLLGMAEQAGVDWLTPSLARITELAAAHGGAAKPSGAGGGDSAVALFPDREAEAAFRRACAEQGLRVLPLALAGPAGALSAEG